MGWEGCGGGREEQDLGHGVWKEQHLGHGQAAPQHLPAGFEAGLNTLTSGLEERLGGEELSLFATSSL